MGKNDRNQLSLIIELDMGLYCFRYFFFTQTHMLFVME